MILEVLVLAAVVAVALALHVDLPWGGRLTLGHAIIVAIVSRAEPELAFAATLAGLALGLPAWVRHSEEGTLAARIAGATSIGIASLFAISTRAALDTYGPVPLDRDLQPIVIASAIGVVFLTVDHAIRALIARTAGARPDLRQAWPLYVTLLSVAVLVDLASRRSLGLAVAATMPLLVTRYSFQRYTTARRTYEQTTRALSLLPEVAGLTPLGHSERTAAYVEAVGNSMGIDPDKVAHLANAARLHHIGHISLHEETERDAEPDPSVLADVSSEILQQTGFLANLVDLVRDCQPGGPPASTLDAAIVRVCSMLDEIVEAGEEFDPFAALVAMHPVGHERAAAIAVLRAGHDKPGLIADARASVELIHQVAAAAAGHDH